MNRIRTAAIVLLSLIALGVASTANAGISAKGHPWTTDEVIAALNKGASQAELAQVLHQDKVEICDKELNFFGPLGVSMNSPLMKELMRQSKQSLPWAAAEADKRVAEHRAKTGRLKIPGLSDALRKKAEHGNRRAMYDLGMALSLDKKNAYSNSTKPKAWLRKAASAGEPLAMAVLGEELEWGRKGDKSMVDINKAVAAYRQAAEAGDPKGAYKLGMAYKHGKGVQRDFLMAERWFTEAAARSPEGYYVENFSLGEMAKLYTLNGVSDVYRDASTSWIKEMRARGGTVARFAERVIKYDPGMKKLMSQPASSASDKPVSKRYSKPASKPAGQPTQAPTSHLECAKRYFSLALGMQQSNPAFSRTMHRRALGAGKKHFGSKQPTQSETAKFNKDIESAAKQRVQAAMGKPSAERALFLNARKCDIQYGLQPTPIPGEEQRRR